MFKKIGWLVVSCLMVLSLVLVSCGQATTPTTPTTPIAPTTPTTPTTSTPTTPATEKEMVKDSFGRLVEKPKYGGVLNLALSTPLMGFDDFYRAPTQMHTLHLTNEELVTGDWTKGPAGTAECTWADIGGAGRLTRMQTGCLAESWEMHDRLTIIFHIRKGVRFALDPNNEASRLVNGREITADDVAFTLNRNLISHQGWFYNYFGSYFESITAIDKYTVVAKGLPGIGSSSPEEMIADSGICYITPREVVESQDES